MKAFRLISRNILRHPLRTSLTVLGMAIAVLAFCVIRSAISAWYAGAEASSPRRLVTSNDVSIIFPLPMAYRDKIAAVPGVTGISYGQWFGGVYIDKKNFFAQFACDPNTLFDLYPEYIIPPEQLEAFKRERNAAIVGRRLADRFGWKLGDVVRLTGTIYPGDWDFVIRGIYTGAYPTTEEASWYFRFDYLDERMRVEAPGRAGQVGWFIVQIDDPMKSAAISDQIDALFANSLAVTKTQTEKAFNLSFIAMSGAIILLMQLVSAMVIGIILLVLANTMAMTARERISEYAILKTLGFRSSHIVGLIFGESVVIAILGGGVGLLLTIPIIGLVRVSLSNFFPVFPLETITILLAAGSAIVVGIGAAVFPTFKALRTSIVDGLRIID